MMVVVLIFQIRNLILDGGPFRSLVEDTEGCQRSMSTQAASRGDKFDCPRGEKKWRKRVTW